jgi:hypothetical protein
VVDDNSEHDLLNFIGHDAIVDWANAHPDEILSAVGGTFDADNQLAVAPAARAVESVELQGGKLIADVTFDIIYRTRVDQEDLDMSATNIADQTLTVELEAPVIHGFEFHNFTVKPDSAY